MFRNPVQWKHGSEELESDTAFRYFFAVDTLAAFEAATLAVVDGKDFVPGYFQVYCEGAAMRHMGLVEPYDRLAVFFKNLALGQTGVEHTMLIEGQSYFDRQYADNAQRRFYQFGEFENVSICGSSTYPCGSVAGTPGYMCVSELLRHMGQ